MFEMEFLEKLNKAVLPEEVIGYLEEHIGEINLMDTEFWERTEMDTLGNLIDKLTTINSKLWHNQEELYKIRKMTQEEFVLVHGKDLKGLHRIVARCCDLNVQRAKLMDEIDKFLSFATNNKDIVREQHKIY